jgi:hypothetical protein
MYNEDKPKEKPHFDRFKGSGLTSRELDWNKQIQRKIDLTAGKSSAASFQKLEKDLKEKNTYFAKSKIAEVNEKDSQLMNSKMSSKYKIKEDEDEETYCQKCPSMKNYCPHKNKKEQIKDKFSYPILSNSAYGWLPPYDNLGDNHNLDSTTKSFYNQGHL